MTRFTDPARPLAAIVLFAAMGLTIGVDAAPAQEAPRDWVIVASNEGAGLGIDRSSIERDGDVATVSVLMGKFRAEVFEPGHDVRYHVSREAFDCRLKTRTELTVLSYGSSDRLNGPVPASSQVRDVVPGSLADFVLVAACDPSVEEDAPGFERPLDAINHERDERLSQGRAVNE